MEAYGMMRLRQPEPRRGSSGPSALWTVVRLSILHCPRDMRRVQLSAVRSTRAPVDAS